MTTLFRTYAEAAKATPAEKRELAEAWVAINCPDDTNPYLVEVILTWLSLSPSNVKAASGVVAYQKGVK